MSESTSTFIEKMNTYGRQINVLLEFDDIVLDKKRVVKLERNVIGELFTSVMRLVTLEVDKKLDIKTADLFSVSDVHNMKNNQLNEARVKYLSGISVEDEKLSEASEINIKVGVKLEDDENYEYTDWGEFVVYEYEDCIDTNSYKLTLYDHLIDTHIKYDDDPLNLNYASNTITVGTLFQAICTKFGFTNMTPTFTNSTKIIHEDKYAGLDVTYRDILDEIACVAGGFIKIFDKNIYVAYPTETGQVIDEHHLKSLNIGEKVGAFNTLVLARSPQEDNIYYPTNIPEEDRVAIRIENNQIMDKNREDYIVDLYNRLNGLEYYPFEYESFGAGYHEFGDIITLVNLDGKRYKTIMMNVVDNINTGITEKAYSEKTTFAETKYQYATSIEKRITNTEIICNKQENQILLLIQSTSSMEQTITQIQLDVDGITEDVQQLTSDLVTVKNEAVQEAVEQASENLGIALQDYSTTVEVETKIETKAGQITTDLTAEIDVKLDNYADTEELANMFSNYSTTIQMENYVNETVGSFERTISEEITTQISNINITTNNLVYNSVGMLGINSWGISQSGALSTNYNASRCSISKRAMIITTSSTSAVYAYTPRFEVNSGGVYSISGWVYCDGESKGLTIDIFSSTNKQVNDPYSYEDNDYTYQAQVEVHANYTVRGVHNSTVSALHNAQVNSFDGNWHYFEKTITLKSNVKSAFIRFGNSGTTDTNIASVVYLSDLMVVEGNKPMHWNVSSKDAQAQIDSNSSSIAQNAYNISLKLNSSSFTSAAVIGLINNRDGTSTAKIASSNINLTASDVINIISGNTINLTSKSIAISSTNFSVDTTGKVTCTNADITGKITATLGKIGGFDINSSSFYLITDDNAKFVIDKTGIKFLSPPTISGTEIRRVILEIKEDDPGQLFTTSITNSQILAQTFKKSGAGYAVTGADTGHNYYLHWDGSNLHAIVDVTDVGIIGRANNGYSPFNGDIPIVNSIRDNGNGTISWNYSNLHVSNGVITGYS